MTLPITPETKVGALLEAYPGVDDVLIEWAPAFAKLKNPILRKTVAKVATLEQAARVGGVSTRDLVRKLREATGQGSGLEVLSDTPNAAPDDGGPPAWLDNERVRHTIDADEMLKTGVHPLGKVRESTTALQPGEIVKLVSAFRPEPLIEAMRNAGLAVYSHQASPGQHATYFCRQGTDPELARRISDVSCGEGSCP
ncbi:MAG: DUF1858 domain-containing protein [bacterium]|nr:DUF1858 domain-containing protein [bacterium]